MANNKATGKDNISVELLKYAPDIVHEKIKTFLNNLFEFHQDIKTGTSELVMTLIVCVVKVGKLLNTSYYTVTNSLLNV